MTTAKSQQWSSIVVQTKPVIHDPREMKTILTFSLRDLWGDLEPHSCMLDVQKDANKGSLLLQIKCPPDSVAAVRAALTMVTPPSYLRSTVYQFDVVDIQLVS